MLNMRSEPDSKNAPSRSAPSGLPDRRTKTRNRTQGKGNALAPEMAGFRLLKLTNLMSRPFFGQFAKQHSLTLNEWRSIVVLASRPGSAAQDVSAATGLHPMNISRAVIALRKRGLVEEARDPDNHRRMLLWLTRAGEDLFETIAPHSEAQNKLLFDVLSADELAAFALTLEKLTVRAEEITQET